MRLNILILGGYGTFGGRLAKLLSEEDRLTLVIGRSQPRAAEFRAASLTKAALLALAFDRDGDVEAQLRVLKPDIVVDASGPFQSYGTDPYRVVRAALALGIRYLDLADDPGFVKGIAKFDDEARARDVFMLSGVSSFPVLTAAVVRHLARGLAQINTTVAELRRRLTPELTERIRAIASYAGKPVALMRDGKQAIGYALSMRAAIQLRRQGDCCSTACTIRL
jgi:saccharopine dehydrogenase-like NADP-dependent oxidoreductase